MFRAFSQSPYLSKDGLIQPDFSHDSLLGFHGTDEELLDILMSWRESTVCRIKESGDVQHFITNAYNLAIFYLLGIGTPVDESEALKWMSRAALLGEGVSTLLFPSIEQSVENSVKQDLGLPRRLWCAAVIQRWGPREATQCLRPIDPYLLQASLAVRRRRLGGWSYKRQFRLTDEYLSPLFDLVGKDPARAMNTAPVLNQLDDVGETILHVCAAMADLQLFRRLLQEESVDINVTNNRGETPLFYAVRAGKLDVARLLVDNGASVNNIKTDGWSLLHCLTMMEDKEAAELAPLLIARYAPMNIEVNETRRGPRCDSFHLGAGIPLFWAALKSCPCLFEVLLLAHRRPGYRIRYGDRYQLLQFLATLNQADMLRLVLEAGDSIVEPDESPIDESARETIRARCRQLVFSISGVPVSRLQPGSVALDVEDFSYLLRHALDTKPMHVLQRRVVHGSGFRRAKKLTLKHLLGAGADPINTRGYDMPRQPRMPELMVAIRHSDTIALEIFLEYAEASGMDVCQLLTRPFRCWVGDLDFDMDAVAVTIRGDARETFAMLLDRYPSVLEKPKRRGVEALRLAAMEDWPGYVETLINLGVADDEDPLVPLFLALSRNNNLDVIKILSEKPGTGMMLKRDPDKRHRAFKVVLHSVLDHKSNIGIDRLRFLVDEYGVPNFTQEDTSLAEIITSDTPATDTARQAFEDAVLRYLLELLPQNINSLDSCGFSPLHRATFYGKSSQVEILLDHGADVHLKTSQEVPGGFAGCRPIDIVRLHRVSEIPEDIAARGSWEIQTWQKNLKTILTLLHDREPPSPMEPGFKIDPETGFPFCEELGPLAGIMTDSVQRHDRRQDGKWPQRMPWESGSPNPFEGPDFNQILSDGYTSYIGSDGLTIFPKARELFGLQMRNGVFNPELMAGTAVEDKPQPPGGMNAALEDYTLRARDLFQINQRLPKGWDIGETEDERLYYIDHSNRRTTWDPPRESA
ncbi:hypothetical protein CEP51_002774 [Fusarium floridanum]|uniref:WW domain-containing protein n=1 Tax=Fusarium floridanum TaxID=1325733 RepID=A0A428S9M4_9HYPO|nr:hypothetical protein CEP51_002774 [Fusarium floridanum]